MVFAHNPLEAMYAYLGMALQGEILQGLFGEMRALFALFFIIGFLWTASVMMFRGEASKVLLYLLFALASIALLGRTMVVDSQALMTGQSGSQLSGADAGARVNVVFYGAVRAFDAVLYGLIRTLDRGFGRGATFVTTPFATARGMMWASGQEIDDATTIREAAAFLDNCLGPTEARLQDADQRGSISGIFGGVGSLVGRPDDDDPAVGSTRAAMREIVPVAGPSSCLEWAERIRGRFGTWLDERRTVLTRVMPQLNEAQIQDITTLALFTAASRLYDRYQSQGISGGLVPGAADEQGEQRRANIFERFARGAGDVVGRLIGSVGEVIIDFARGLINTIVPAIQGWLIMILYAFFPIGVLISLLPGMQMKVLDYLGAIWWVKSWTLFLGLISHVLEALYRIRGGTARIGDTAEFVSQGVGLLTMTNNMAWMYIFLVLVTPLISYMLFFGRLGGLAYMRFRFVGLGLVTQAGRMAAR